jgi:hypothetical protein
MLTKNLDFDFPMQFDQGKTHQSTSAAQKFGDQNLDHQIAMELDDTCN